MATIAVDPELCQGHARCCEIDPEIFTVDELGYSNIGRGRVVPPDGLAAARRAVAVCPERALSLDESDA